MRTGKVELKAGIPRGSSAFLRRADISKAAAAFGIFILAMFALPGSLSAGGRLDINGEFAREGKGWLPNMGCWDAGGEKLWNKLLGADKNSLMLISKHNPMHLSFEKYTPFSPGDTLVIKAMVKGRGAGILGAYYTPGGGFSRENFTLSRDFAPTNDWIEVAARIALPKGNELSVVIGVEPDAAVEFRDVRAELEGK